jgi:hypothetical protein
MSSAHAERQARYREWLGDHVEALYGFSDEISRLANNSLLGVRNDTPPVELWHRIVPTIRLVEVMRGQFGPTTVNSAYRSRAYNTAVTKKPLSKSQHLQNTAIDFRCRDGKPAEWAERLRAMRDAVAAYAPLERRMAEAIRAVRDTLPLLKAAEKVTVMTCERGHSAENADADIRAYLARQLIASLDDTVDADAETQWSEVIDRRSREIEEGRLSCRPVEETIRVIRAKLHAGCQPS